MQSCVDCGKELPHPILRCEECKAAKTHPKKVLDIFTQLTDTIPVPKLHSKVVRMLNYEAFDMSVKVSARLVKDIDFTKDDEVMVYPAGTVIWVDMESMVANIEGDHTDVALDEFEVLFPN
jgi:hypothetical protein